MQGVLTRKMDKFVKNLGIESLSRSHESDVSKGPNEQMQSFRERLLAGEAYPTLWVDVLEGTLPGHVISMASQIVCGVNTQGRREVPVVELMLEESKDPYQQMFDSLKARVFRSLSLVVSVVYKGLIAAIRKSSTGASWQRCKVHFRGMKPYAKYPRLYPVPWQSGIRRATQGDLACRLCGSSKGARCSAG